MKLRASPLVLLAIFVLYATLTAGCAGPREAVETPPEDAEELPTPAVDLSDFEDFDVAAYPETPPAAPASVEHDVPAELMRGTGSQPVESRRSGFRVQIFSTLDKSAAVETEEEASAWWRSFREEEGEEVNLDALPEDLPLYTVYMQPYYRVRVGNFTSREEAAEARDLLARHFQGAFVVPDEVVVTR